MNFTRVPLPREIKWQPRCSPRALRIPPRGRLPQPRPLGQTHFSFGFKRVPDAPAHAGGGCGGHRCGLRVLPSEARAEAEPAALPGRARPALPEPRGAEGAASAPPGGQRRAGSAPSRPQRPRAAGATGSGRTGPGPCPPSCHPSFPLRDCGAPTCLLHFSCLLVCPLLQAAAQRTGYLGKQPGDDRACLFREVPRVTKGEPSVTMSPCAAAKAQPGPRFSSLYCVPQLLSLPDIPL